MELKWRIIVYFILFSGSIFSANGQTKYTIQGIVTDISNKVTLPGAVISVKELPNIGTASESDGSYLLSLPEGRYTLFCSFMGYETVEKIITVNKPLNLNFDLKENSVQLQEVVVSSKSVTGKLETTQIGVEQIEIAEMAKIPALFGERDILKSIQLLPGIKSEGDGSSGYQVRGGTSSQNMIYLDAAPIYNAGHLMGIFSTFNDDALVNASLYKGQIPAQLGGATSSVFDINTKNGNFQRYKLNATIGLLSAKVSTEGPIVKDKLSFFVAGRRSYLDLFLKATDKYKDNVLNFYDINAKVNYNITDKDKLFISFFSGQDNMGLKDMMEMKWGNNATTLRWFHDFNDNLYANTSLIYAVYKATSGLEILDNDYSYDTFIKQAGIKEEIKWIAGRGHNMNMGFHSLYLSVLSAEWNINNLHEKEKRNVWENALWVNDDWNLSESFMISAGLRVNIFSVLGGSPLYSLDNNGDILEQFDYKSGKIVKSYYSWEPRLSLNYRLTSQQSIKLGYSRTSQNIHALRTGSSSMPFDRYTMSSNIVKPQLANQVSLGYITVTNNNKYEFSAESYYKKTQNVLDYKDGKSLLSEIEIERLILSGKGRAYGLEFYARKNLGRLTGWVGYTLSWSENKIEGINNDKWYTASNDRRHDISVVGMYDLSDKWQLAATWVYNTGQALTAPSAKYELDGETYYYYAERNGYRAPAYHRLDVSATRTKKKGRYEQEWSFGIYNLYNQYNPYIIRFENDDKKPSGTKTIQYSLFGFLPSVSYTFKF